MSTLAGPWQRACKQVVKPRLTVGLTTPERTRDAAARDVSASDVQQVMPSHAQKPATSRAGLRHGATACSVTPPPLRRRSNRVELEVGRPSTGQPEGSEQGALAMATRMSLWRLHDDGSASAVEEQILASEEKIEAAVEDSPELLGMDVLIVGRQTQTPSGPLDLLAIDADGRLVVIENKRNRTPREVLAQTIDYAAWVSTLTFDEVETIYAKYKAASADSADLADDFEEHFGEQLDAIADVPRMVIVAAHLDDSTERMIDFLSDTFSVPVNAVLFQPFAGDLIGRTWLRPDVDKSSASGKRSSASAASREQAKQFWDSWLPIGRAVLSDIKLPQSGPRAVWLKRIITPGIPAMIQVWVTSTEAYAEVQFDDDDAELNEALLTTLAKRQSEIEMSMGSALDWRGLATSGARTKRTKVVGPRVPIGNRTEPTVEGMRELAQSARRLIDAVKPHLVDVYDEATSMMDSSDVIMARQAPSDHR